MESSSARARDWQLRLLKKERPDWGGTESSSAGEIGSCDCWRKRGQTGGTESRSAGTRYKRAAYMLISRPDTQCVLFVWYSVPEVQLHSDDTCNCCTFCMHTRSGSPHNVVHSSSKLYR